MLIGRLVVSKHEAGQGLVEYSLIIVFLAVLVIVALNLLGSGITESLYDEIIANL